MRVSRVVFVVSSNTLFSGETLPRYCADLVAGLLSPKSCSDTAVTKTAIARPMSLSLPVQPGFGKVKVVFSAPFSNAAAAYKPKRALTLTFV
jgi:hypothetical protein